MNTQTKTFLPWNWWRFHGRSTIFNHRRNLYAGWWRHCYNYVARWWQKYLPRPSPVKDTCSWRDQLIVLWILNRQAKTPNEWKNISRNVVNLYILLDDVINLLYYEYWTGKQKYIYQQTYGVAMGVPASLTTAEIYMQAYEFTAVTTFPDDGRSHSGNVAYLNILFHDVINLFYCEYWKFKQKYIYQNTDGVAMGVPASSTTAEIYMQAYERTAITRLPNDGTSISRNVAHLKILLHDAINLLYYECWTDKQKYIYQQTDGVATVGPGSSITAEIYMQVYERTAITTLPDDGRSISRDVAHLYILVHDVINLLCYECWTDKQKIILRTNWWRCHGRASIFNHSRNLCAGLWIQCYNYVGWWSKKCVSKRIQLKHTCSWRDKSIVL